MNTKAPVRARPDLDAALFDFAAAYAENPQEALHRLYVLLLDEDTCRARGAFLRGLAQNAEVGASSPNQETPSLLAEALDLVRGGDLFACSLRPAEVRTLARLTCDPKALEVAHRWLVDGEPEASPTRIEAATAGSPAASSPTSLLLAGQGNLVAEGLSPWLPFLLRRTGWEESLADDLRVHLRNRLQEVPAAGLRFRDLLARWLEEFAATHPPSRRFRPLQDEEYREMIEEAAFERVVGGGTEDEPAWAKTVRTLARAERARSPEDLLRLSLPDEIAEERAAVTFLFGLATELRECYKKGLQTFECLDG